LNKRRPGHDRRATLDEAVRRHRAGRLDKAEALYRAVLKQQPEQPDALHLLGLIRQAAGHPDEAEALIRRAIAAGGRRPVYLSNLGAALLMRGRLEEAEASCREAVRREPGLADGHVNLGVVLSKLDRCDEAVVVLRQAVRLAPAHANGRLALGNALQKKGELSEAIAHLREAVRLAPGNAQARESLGSALVACQQALEGLTHLREAVRLDPSSANARHKLGMALNLCGLAEEAAASFREAIRLDPSHAGAHNSAGSSLKNWGRIEEAVAEFKEALRLEPGHAAALQQLAELATSGHYRLTDEEAARLGERLGAAGGELSLDDACDLGFAQAVILERAGRHDEAFELYRQANDLRRQWSEKQGLGFDPHATRRFVDETIAAFTPAFFERVRSWADASEVPVFVVGMPRSGTSLVEQILASHPSAFGAGELLDMSELFKSLPHRLGGPYPQCLERLGPRATRDMAGEYLSRLAGVGGAALRVVDKMPLNVMRLGLIATLFPRAKVIHCRRDPIDVCLSCYFRNFQSVTFATDLRHLGQFFNQYQRLSRHWEAVLPMPVFHVDYEELTANQEDVSRRMVEFVGLPWDDRCLRFFETPRAAHNASALQVRKPMYRSSVGRWKPYEKHLGPLLEELAS
jgi:tetratricopeptide (TPR) repeat protein